MRINAASCEPNRKLFRRLLITELSHGDRASADAIEAIVGHLRVKPVPGAMVIVQIDALASCPKDSRANLSDHLLCQLSSSISVELSRFRAGAVGTVDGDRVAALLSPGPAANLTGDEVMQAAEGLRHVAKVSRCGTLTIGVGNVYQEPKDLAKSYQEAKDALEYQMFLGNDRVFAMGRDVLGGDELNVARSWLYPMQEERKLRERIMAGDKEGTFRALDILLDALRTQPGLTPITFKSQVLQAVIALSRTALHMGVAAGTFTATTLQYAQTVRETDSFPALRAFLRSMVDGLVDAVFGRARTPKSEAIVLAKKYISEHYTKPLSLREVSDYVHLSPYYFSRLFAKEHSCGFQDYLHRIRIEAAKDVLRHSTVKTRQAATMVGFKSTSHFVSLFRRVEGTTPARFARAVGQVHK
ncbi:MAG: helix-turn-helix domain-containing protein [Chloroflexi bacterium]|nr:helix-turn-helix domain-containing protein [Chloroflexota bacterium]